MGDGEAVVKGFKNFGNIKKWKKQIYKFTKDGGGVVGICGGAALITSLDMGPNKKPKTLTEKHYDKSSIKITKGFLRLGMKPRICSDAHPLTL